MNTTDHAALGHLSALLLALRPDWTAEAVRAALQDRAVWVKPFPVVACAAILCAVDTETRAPGRLAQPGPWWRQVGATPPVSGPVTAPSGPVAGPDCTGRVLARRIAAEAAERAARTVATASQPATTEGAHSE